MNDQADKEVRTQLRLPADLHELVVNSANRSNRSMNAEIVHRLQTSFRQSFEAELIENRRRELGKLEAETHALVGAVTELRRLRDMGVIDPERKRQQEADIERMEERIEVLRILAKRVESEATWLQKRTFDGAGNPRL